MDLTNRTHLNTDELQRRMRTAADGWSLGRLRVHVRYSRRADYSGTCYYKQGVIYVNLGRHLAYPYRLGTSVAPAKSNARHWWKPIYTLELADEYQVALFVFLHELYHWLVHRARRNPRQKESMCDRFAARILVDRFGVRVRDERGRLARREAWDIQNVEAFVAAARPPRPVPAARAAVRPVAPAPIRNGQWLLFDLA
jgi:predicted SprT family Zn-dependent metalloprotease